MMRGEGIWGHIPQAQTWGSVSIAMAGDDQGVLFCFVFLTTALGFVRDVTKVDSLELHRRVVETQEWGWEGWLSGVCLG